MPTFPQQIARVISANLGEGPALVGRMFAILSSGQTASYVFSKAKIAILWRGQFQKAKIVVGD
jgi:hypothetical protein